MMNRLYILTINLLLAITLVHASPSNFEIANDFYAEKEYTKAAEMYETILSEEGMAPEIYYNLGNSYFRMNELGKSILNYERALRLNPSYKDAKFNLAFANQSVVDKLELSDSFFLKKWVHKLINSLSSTTWFYISAVMFIFTLISLLIFIFGKNKITRKVLFYFAIVLLLNTVLTLYFSFNKRNSMKLHEEGIVMTGSVVIKASPDKSGTDLFQLHEGTKVGLVSTLGDWYEIKLPNGNTGWVEIIHLEKI